MLLHSYPIFNLMLNYVHHSHVKYLGILCYYTPMTPFKGIYVHLKYIFTYITKVYQLAKYSWLTSKP